MLGKTLVTNDKDYLGKIDIFKQLGYLIGLALSYSFYKIEKHLSHYRARIKSIYLLPSNTVQLTIILFCTYHLEEINL